MNAETKKDPQVRICEILEQNKIRLITPTWANQIKTLKRVKNPEGKNLLLKTERIEPHQIALMKIAKGMEENLSFKVPEIINHGEDWLLMEEIHGKSLNDYYDADPEWAVKISKAIADDYQTLLANFFKKENPGNLFKQGRRWTDAKLCSWGGPIIEKGLLTFFDLKTLHDEIDLIIEDLFENAFGWFHGNIIGDHVKVAENNDVYLFDLHIVPRFGRNYYDFLRALDFLFLKAEDADKIFRLIPKWLNQYLGSKDMKEVKLAFALRNIGILGWDTIRPDNEFTRARLKRMGHLMLKFIKREY